MKRSLFLVLLLGIAVAGCSDDTAGPDGGSFDPFALWTASPDATYGQFYVTSSWSARADHPAYRSGGQIYNNTDHDSMVSGGVMIASNTQITKLGPVAYNHMRGGQGNGPTFGAITAWSLSGNSLAGIPAFTDSMYVPAEIRLTAPGVAVPSISRSAPLTITWNADANNEAILILIDYRVDESLMRDSNLTTTPYRWKVITDDDGSHTVSASDLAGLPAGGIVEITLARGTSKLSGTPSHPFHIYAYTTATIFHSVSQ